ncbi:ATP-dependent DNA helicase hus2/rqh1 [Leucoagaricus sp. SymC.cos]|nr:ATP-dependent DNA helicase hus2/rqh1 [Leucoagaricus sp. SymC.cos]
MNIAFRRRHCQRFENLIELDEQDTPGALQAGHSRATENQHYGRTNAFLGDLAEDMTMPLVKASTDWQVMLGIPKGGLVLPYTLLEDETRWAQYLSPQISPFLQHENVQRRNPLPYNPTLSSLSSHVTTPDLFLPDKDQDDEGPPLSQLKHHKYKSKIQKPGLTAEVVEIVGYDHVMSDDYNIDDTYATPKVSGENVVDLNNLTIPGWPEPSQPLESSNLLDADCKDTTQSEWKGKAKKKVGDPVETRRDENATRQQKGSTLSQTAGKDVSKSKGKGKGEGELTKSIEKDDRIAPDEVECSALKCLRKLLRNPSADWTSEYQRLAVLTALERDSDLIVILPTGSGKTMIPAISARLHPRSVIGIIVPFVALLDDTMRQFQGYGISCAVFERNMAEFPENCPIVLCIIDLAVTREFRVCVLRAIARNRMRTLLIDEVHEVPTAKKYRPVMETAYVLSSAGCQVIAMSATIPPPMERLIIDTLHLTQGLKVIRASSNRPELQYKLEHRLTSAETLRTRTTHIVNLETQLYTSTRDRGLIFVNSMADGGNLSDLLRCEFYNGTLEPTKRQEMVNRWRGGVNRVMVCTSAFSAGYDYDSVRFVILYDTPYEMVQSIQEMGRAGRDRNTARCYILPLNKRNREASDNDPMDVVGRMAMHNMIFNSEECIRLCITRFNDTFGVLCGDSEENETCSRCLQRALEPLRIEEPHPENVAGQRHGEAKTSSHTEEPGETIAHPHIEEPRPNIRRRGEYKMVTRMPEPPTWGRKKPVGPVRPLTTHDIPNPPPAPPKKTLPPPRRQLDFVDIGTGRLHGEKAGNVLVPASSPSDPQPSSSAVPGSSRDSVSSGFGSKRSTPSSVFDERARDVKRKRVTAAVDLDQYAERLKKALGHLEEKCSSCLIQNSYDGESDHLANNCNLFKEHFSRMARWRKDIRFTKNKHGKLCTCCWVPQINDDLHPFISQGQKAADECKYPDLIPPLLYLIYVDPKYSDMAQEHFNVTWGNPGAFARWICAEPVEGHTSNAMALLLWFVEVCWRKS